MAAGRTLLGLVMIASCSTTPDPCLRDQVSISTGVYGVIWKSCELGGGCDATHLGRPVHDMKIGLFADQTQPPEGVALAQTTSGQDGFYQLSIPPGTYNLCELSFAPLCTSVTVTAEATRYDTVPYQALGSDVRWSTVACQD
jgi:hypothetical protein